MSIDDLIPCSVTELKGMFGPATRTVSIAKMNRSMAARAGATGEAKLHIEEAPAARDDSENR